MIAIENARLFDEVQAKTRDLEESLQQQTATADVLKAISRTAFDLDTVLQTLISTAVRLCDASGGEIFRRHGDVFRYAASLMDVDPAYLEHEQKAEIRPAEGRSSGVSLSRSGPLRSPTPGTTRNMRKRNKFALAACGPCWACRSCATAS